MHPRSTFWPHRNTDSIHYSELSKTWCHWINRYKLYFFCVLVVHMQSTFPNRSHGIRNPFTLQFAFQKGGVDVSRRHPIVLHKVTGRRGNIPPLSRFIGGRRWLWCSESRLLSCVRLLLLHKKGCVFDWANTFGGRPRLSLFLPLVELEVNRQHDGGIRKASQTWNHI